MREILNIGVRSSSIFRLIIRWWTQWSRIADGQWTQPSIPIHRQVQNGWIDFFLGDSQDSQCHRLLDSQSRVGLHYRKSDLEAIFWMDCPSAEIPDRLWRQLQEQYVRWYSKYSRFSSYSRIFTK